jgi:hypothetical protein
MKLQVPESPLQRMALAIGAAVAIMVVGGLIYLATPGEAPPAKIDGPKIVAAASAYTRGLIAHKQHIPKTVSLNVLLAGGYLKPADVAPFQGMEATLSLVSDVSNPDYVLMRVHMPDGSDIVLLADGSAKQVPRDK